MALRGTRSPARGVPGGETAIGHKPHLPGIAALRIRPGNGHAHFQQFDGILRFLTFHERKIALEGFVGMLNFAKEVHASVLSPIWNFVPRREQQRLERAEVLSEGPITGKEA